MGRHDAVASTAEQRPSAASPSPPPPPPPPPPAPPGFRWPTALPGRTPAVPATAEPVGDADHETPVADVPPAEALPPPVIEPAPFESRRGDDAPTEAGSPPPSLAFVAAAQVPPHEFHEVPINFTPLRADPPPKLFATWWLRYLLFLAQIVALAVVLLREYAVGPDDVARSPIVLAAYLVVTVLLVAWSALALVDASRLVPATRYQPRSRPLVGVALWLVAFVAPIGAVAAVRWAQDRFAADPDDLTVVAVTVVSVLVSFLLVWLPFQYHTRQAHRIGAPSRVVAGWFWLPLGSAVGGLAINALGLHDHLAEDGFTDWDRTVQVAVVFGLPALTFALATWRATTVFDEVIELRWLRWRTEWEQTLAAMASQPAPGPEIAPDSRRR